MRIRPKQILFNGHGQGYNDSPKAIFEYMRHHSDYKNYKFIWALDEPHEYKISGAEIVKMDTIKYFLTALTSEYWVSCVNIERGLNFKKKQTRYLNTWHGIPLKKVGNGVNGRRDFDFSSIDLFCYSGEYERDIYINDFLVNENNLLFVGMPRNDDLFNLQEIKIKQTKRLLNLPENKKVILYAPTWRDSTDGGKTYQFQPHINIDLWREKLGEDYVVLFRTHAYTNETLGIEFDETIRDYSDYSDINDLLIVSDLLISDYSATIFDFAILERPILSFGYDYVHYKNKRGFYLDLTSALPNGIYEEEEELLKKITTMDYNYECKKTAKFKKKFIEVKGNASKACVKKLIG